MNIIENIYILNINVIFILNINITIIKYIISILIIIINLYVIFKFSLKKK